MCQLKAGALFKQKRKKAEELKELFILIRAFRDTHTDVKSRTCAAVLMSIRLGMAIQAQKGDLRAARIIQQRALRAGVIV